MDSEILKSVIVSFNFVIFEITFSFDLMLQNKKVTMQKLRPVPPGPTSVSVSVSVSRDLVRKSGFPTYLYRWCIQAYLSGHCVSRK